MRLTPRDVEVLLAVHAYRVLRRDQLQTLLFPSKNRANERLMRLYQHGFLARRWLPVEYGQGMGQALYLLERRGADVVAGALGVDRGQIKWKRTHNHVTSLFLKHTLMVNDLRISVAQAAESRGYRLESWVTEDELAAARDVVHVSTPKGARKVALIPDAYFVLHLGHRRSHFFLEADRATVSNPRWALRIGAYDKYVRSGAYARHHGTRSLRVLTVTTSAKRLANLLRTTEEGGGGGVFWFTTLAQATKEDTLAAPIWRAAGHQNTVPLIESTQALPAQGGLSFGVLSRVLPTDGRRSSPRDSRVNGLV